MTEIFTFYLKSAFFSLSSGCLVIIGLHFYPITISAQESASSVFSKVLATERNLRNPAKHLTASKYREAIASYEKVANDFPLSNFADRALWQAAGLSIEAYDLHRQRIDLETGKRLLQQLEDNYPQSSLTPRVLERRQQIDFLGRLSRIETISRELLPDAVRVTISLNLEAEYQATYLTDPDRLYFDFNNTETTPPLRNQHLEYFDDEVVQEVRLGQRPNNITRVVLDTEGTKNCHTSILHEPFRLAIDCQRELATPPNFETTLQAMQSELFTEGISTASFRKSQLPAVNSDGYFSAARQLGLGISRIVIDPGHGGNDPGASAKGIDESELVLDLALRLEKRLRSVQPHLEVILTRRNDQYIPLEERTNLANRVESDLFLSIHANSSPNSEVRGIETYFLNFTADPEAEALAARENIEGIATMKQLDVLLEAIAANNKINESRDFAESVQNSLLNTLQKVDPDFPDLGVKQAPFLVLIGAKMPSILSEISFLSNDQDARRLSSNSYRDLIADALLDGIVNYQQSLSSPSFLASADNSAE